MERGGQFSGSEPRTDEPSKLRKKSDGKNREDPLHTSVLEETKPRILSHSGRIFQSWYVRDGSTSFLRRIPKQSTFTLSIRASSGWRCSCGAKGSSRLDNRRWRSPRLVMALPPCRWHFTARSHEVTEAVAFAAPVRFVMPKRITVSVTNCPCLLGR